MIQDITGTNETAHNYAVIVAGGSGTRLWPLSRKELPKQIQKVISDKTLIQETVDRISGVVPYDHIFISTTKNYADKVKDTLPDIPAENIIVEPIARGTTAAFAYFSEKIYRMDSEATIFSLASDHSISDTTQFQDTMRAAYQQVNEYPHTICLVGVKPDKPDTGLGYIKVDTTLSESKEIFSVEKFVEKPSLSVARSYVESGEYYWNAAYYCYKAKTLIQAYEEADGKIMDGVRNYIKSSNDDDFIAIPEKPHEIEIINAKKFPLVLVPAYFTWSDIGNWGALHDLLVDTQGDESKIVSGTTKHIDFDSENCMVVSHNDQKLVATVGLSNLIIVDTEDALLVMDKNHTQDIKQALKLIKEKGLDKYL